MDGGNGNLASDVLRNRVNLVTFVVYLRKRLHYEKRFVIQVAQREKFQVGLLCCQLPQAGSSQVDFLHDA